MHIYFKFWLQEVSVFYWERNPVIMDMINFDSKCLCDVGLCEAESGFACSEKKNPTGINRSCYSNIKNIIPGPPKVDPFLLHFLVML